ncbi:MAG: S9 family peptidase [Chloroflexota bacterium]
MTEQFTIDRMLQLPRLSSLQLSPDGRRLVVAVGTVAPDNKKMATSLWQVDPEGRSPARRLTRSQAGESGGHAFLPDGSLLFTSARPDPSVKAPSGDDAHPIHALWLLPPDGGEARPVASPDGGIDGIAVARDARALAFGAAVHRAAADLEADEAKEKARREAGVKALLFEDYPIRHWDHYLGPRYRRLFSAVVPEGEAKIEAPRDLEASVGAFTFEDGPMDIAPDGSFVVAVRRIPNGFPETLDDLVLYDTQTGAATQLTHGDAAYIDCAISPDGRTVAAIKFTYASPAEPEQYSLVLLDIATGDQREIAREADRRPEAPQWGRDASELYFEADDEGLRSAYRVDLPEGRVTRLTAAGHISDLCPTPDGSTVYALQSTVTTPPRIVRFDAHAADQTPVELENSLDEGGIEVDSLLDRIEATAADGTRIGAWLVRPAGASSQAKAPLVVFVHGGPVSSWNGWHWRWNPNVLAARGFAVLLPDPAFSTGYGQALFERGWGQWGGNPYTDVIALTDAALARVDIDSTKTALMGGSYGGYMANWVAGQTNRFKAIITHASLYELVGFHGTTDHGPAWEHEMGNIYEDQDLYRRWSPREFLAKMAEFKTPMLVTHGELDARVPISEALTLWTDMQRMGILGKFLYFPDENHWILKPQNARLWYGTVLAFLDEHLNGVAFERDALL